MTKPDSNITAKIPHAESLAIALSVFMGLVLFIAISLFNREDIDRPAKYCFPISEEKSRSDEEFAQVRCQGIIEQSKYKDFGHGNDRFYFEIAPFPEFGFQPSPGSSLSLSFTSAQNHARLGLDGVMARFITNGDTFLKMEGEVFFTILRTTGDTVRGEYDGPPRCFNKDCTYERTDDNLCYQTE